MDNSDMQSDEKNSFSSINNQLISCWKPYIGILEDVRKFYDGTAKMSVDSFIIRSKSDGESKKRIINAKGMLTVEMWHLSQYYEDYIIHGNSSLMNICESILQMFSKNKDILLNVQNPDTFELSTTFNIEKLHRFMWDILKLYVSSFTIMEDLTPYYGDSWLSNMETLNILRKPLWNHSVSIIELLSIHASVIAIFWLTVSLSWLVFNSDQPGIKTVVQRIVIKPLF